MAPFSRESRLWCVMTTKHCLSDHLSHAGASLFLALGMTLGSLASSRGERIVFYAPVTTASVSPKTHITTYTTNNQILTMNVDGSDVRQLTTGTSDCSHPSWQPGQTHILFHSSGILYVIDANGGGKFAVAADRGVGADWSSDGKMICYVGDPLTPPGPMGLWLVAVDPNAKGNKKLGTPILVSSGDFYGPAWSHDGTRIAFSDQLEPGGGPHVRVLDLATGVKTTLTSMTGLLPAWSSSDGKIAFVSGANTTGFWQLFIMNPDFTEISQVTSFNNSVLWPAWSPDSLQVAFRIGTGKGWDAALYKLTLATGELTLLRDKADHADWNP